MGSSGGAGGWYRNVRFASGANDPLVAVAGVRSRPGAALPATLSFASLSVPNVLVSTIKKAEDDDSVVVRCYETDGEPVDAVLRLFRPFRSALRTDIIEEGGTPVPLRDGGLRVKLGKHAIETYRLRPGPSVAAASSPRR